MKLNVIGIFFLLFSLSISAQESNYNHVQSSREPDSTIIQNLHITQDARIDTLLKRYIGMSKRMNGTEGYRLEIFFSSGLRAKEEAMDVKTEFLKNFPDVPAYLIFTSPDFKVRVGDFRSRDDALALKNRIRRLYPNAFLAKDIIQFPKLYSEKQSNE